ncbi:hypothetical protein A2415_01970 [candidate division WWE3 bacterium RIFOXYC1_FULL_39_7]|uniref:Uncharacterized protein n=2 Tax=Katanobacteria TaxID=422282 RepID=A0A1F4X9C6_UNCKA|nr:MAG: hypothetical protein A2415_01970 [candidate division WWE3 bacterium RIFOXYC1_FULL_39_7]OGC78131.1 MAG: hypothetical protein A2619_05265 [candidate division WWE3 bacterium RIFOXYD1_FULL_39_9]
MINSFKHKNEKGQTAIAMLVLMVVALMIGVTVSDRFIRGLRSIASSDNTSKAVAAAEAAIERLLVLPNETLEDFITFNNCGSNCVYQITDPNNGQLITATVTLSHMGSTSEPYLMSLKEVETSEMSLNGYASGQSVNVCWNGTTSIEGLYVYNEGGTIKVSPFAYNSTTTAHPENGFTAAAGSYGYQNCFSVTASNTPLSLRLKSVYGPVDVDVLPAPGYNIPTQGIRLVSVGVAGDARKTVTVIKSEAFAPVIFDYVLYQKSDTDALSN